MVRPDLSTIVLVICSVLAVATMIERTIRYVSADIDAAQFMVRIRELVRTGLLPDALTLADTTPGPFAAVVKAGLLCRERPKDELKDAIERVRVRQAAFLDRRLPILGTIGATAPFIGLLGTVMGILKAFHDIAQAGSAGTAVVADGIARALVATAFGLVVAIIAVIAYNFFVNWSGHFSVEMDTAANELLHMLKPEDAPVRRSAD